MTALTTQPEELSLRKRPSGLAVRIRVPAGLDWFRGHFPGTPILPGVVQLDWAIAYARGHLGVDPAIERVVGLKFMRVVRPGAELELDLAWSPADRELRFEYTENEQACSCGRFFLAR
ncbi:MAG TPA: hypothetical protein VH542_11165 [Steroidobacteraceae bacterium]